MRFDNEKELEDLILKHHAENDNECIVTGHTVAEMHQQFRLPGYGVIDILSLNIGATPGMVVVEAGVYELKQGNIKLQDVAQVARYFRGICRYIWHAYGVDVVSGEGYDKSGEIQVKVSCFLVGRGYSGDTNDLCYLVDSIPWLSCHHFSLAANGVQFKESEGWYNDGETTEKLPSSKITVTRKVKKEIISMERFLRERGESGRVVDE